MASENAVDKIKLHQETIASDDNSPLHLIREKELEITGRMLSAKRQADELVTEARKRAAEVISTAEAESGAGARARAECLISDARDEATSLADASNREATELRTRIGTRIDAAVSLVVDAVTAG